MAILTVQKISQDGVSPGFAAAAAGGDTVPNKHGDVFVHVKNASAAAITVTVDAITKCNHGFDHNLSVSVPASGEKVIGPLPTNRFGADVAVTYSAVTSVSVAAIRLPVL